MATVLLQPLLKHEYLQSAGRYVADSLACQLDPKTMLSVSDALHSVAFSCDEVLANPAAKPEHALWLGGTLADNVTEGEALIVFADANPRRGYSAAHVSISAIADCRSAAAAPSPRFAKANTVARQLSRAVYNARLRQPAKKEPPEVDHGRLIELAAHVLDDRAFERLSNMTDCVPVVAIIGDTRATGITSQRFIVSVTSLPGSWLGVSQPAGSC